MPVDSRYKGNRILKDAGQKPQNAEDKEYVEMIQQQTTFEADAEGGDFRYSENYQNFDPEKKDYSDLEYTYPPFNPPPFDPWFDPVIPKDDPPGGGDITNEFGCKDPSFCWCPDEERCGAVSCTQEAVAAEVSDPASGASAYCHHNKLCVTGAEVSPDSLSIEITMQSRTSIPGGEVRTQARDTVVVERCAAEKCCNCTKSKIVYTTNQMNISETQNLSASEISKGCKDKVKLLWTVTNGSLDKYTGAEVVFTAPATNINCDEDADINLYCDGKLIDSLHITINASGTGYAVVYNTCYQEGGDCSSGPGLLYVEQVAYDCSGSQVRNIRCFCTRCLTAPKCVVSDPCIGLRKCERSFAESDSCDARGVTSYTCADLSAHLTPTRDICGDTYGDVYYPCAEVVGGSGTYPLGAAPLDTYTDIRTTEMKNAGCCPPQLS